MSITRKEVIEALRNVQDPELHRDLVSLEMIKTVDIEDDSVRLGVELTTPACPMKDEIKGSIEAELAKLGVSDVAIDWSADVRQTPQAQMFLPGVKNTIAIGAGKGGVGKSTISVLAALGLQREGASVGLMDADVYGPSIPQMLGVEGQRPLIRDDKIMPIEVHGIKVMSMGFLLEPDHAVIWRGPMVHGAVQQFLSQVDWGELDYLIIDLPPGTGDVPLTLAQSLPMTGAVIVCTPQSVALADAMRAMKMYQQLNVQILGLVENMSYFKAPDTGNEYDLFGRGGASKAAAEANIPCLGEIPINTTIRTSGDEGTPTKCFTSEDGVTSEAIMSFVRNLAAQVSMRDMRTAAAPTLKVT